MSDITVSDPRIVEKTLSGDRITFELSTRNSETVTLAAGDRLEITGEHVFSGVVQELAYDTDNLGGQHHWITFVDVDTDSSDPISDPHTLPLGELATQLASGSYSITHGLKNTTDA